VCEVQNEYANMEVKILEWEFDKEEFNRASSHPLQSWEWGEARKQMGIDVLRIGEFQKDKLINVFTITFHNIPYTSLTIGYLPRSVMPKDELLKKIHEEGRRRNAIFVKIEPYIVTENKNLKAEDTFSNLKFQISIRTSPHPLFPKWTQMIDLTLPEEKLLANMKPKTRYNIRVAQKHGVIIKEMTNNVGFEIFSKLYFTTTSRQKYHGHNDIYHRTIFETLKKDISHIFIVFYKNIPLAAYHVFLFNKVLYYPYGGSSEEHKEVMASNLLMWEVMNFGKKHGAKVFDMWGSLPSNYNRSAPWSGFTRFKEGYGGEFVEFLGSYDMIINRYIYYLYNIVYKLRRLIL